MLDPYLKNALKGKSESTSYSYTVTLDKCLAVTKCKDSRALLVGRANTFRKLSELWPVVTTLKKALAIMCSITRTNPGMIPATTKAYWLARLEDANAMVKKQNSNNVVSSALQAKWLDYDDILAKVEELIAQGNEHATLKASQEVVLLAMYAYLTPKRADFGKLRIVASIGKLQDDENGLVLPSKGDCRLVLNQYKTAKTYKQFTEVLPVELAVIVRASLEAWPRTYLLVGPRDKPLSDNNYSTRVGDVMDKHLDRRLSVNDLRRGGDPRTARRHCTVNDALA
jgi:hypothetical protein